MLVFRNAFISLEDIGRLLSAVGQDSSSFSSLRRLALSVSQEQGPALVQGFSAAISQCGFANLEDLNLYQVKMGYAGLVALCQVLKGSAGAQEFDGIYNE